MKTFLTVTIVSAGVIKCNLGSLEIRVSTYISAKLKKRTYMYDSLQFTVEINTRGSKTDNFYMTYRNSFDYFLSYLQNGML